MLVEEEAGVLAAGVDAAGALVLVEVEVEGAVEVLEEPLRESVR